MTQKLSNQARRQMLTKILGLISANHFLKAWEISKKNLNKNPDDMDWLHLGGVALHKLNRNEEGAKLIEKALKQAPKRGDMYNSLAQCYRNIDTDKAREYALRSVELKPIAAHLTNLATIEFGLGYFVDAIAHVKRAVTIEPQYKDGWRLLAHLMNEMCRYAEALEFVEELPKDDIQRIQLEIDAYTGLNQPDVVFDRIVKLGKYPKLSGDQLLFCFSALRNIARSDEFEGLFSHHLTKANNVRLLVALKQKPSEELIRKAISIYQKITPNTPAKRNFAFNIADAYKKVDRKKWFEWLKEANGIILPGYEYDEAKITQCFEQARQKINDINALPSSESDNATPIFVLGMPRSGTTLTESIIGAHSSCFPCGEQYVLGNLLNVEGNLKGHQRNFSIFYNLERLSEKEELQNISSRYINSLRKIERHTAYLVDKLPHNFVYLGLLAKIFPKAKVIHIKRNPIANILSVFEQNFSSFHSYGGRIDTLIRYYRLYEQHIKAMKSTLPKGYLYELQYEDLVQDTEKQVKQLLDFCDLPFEQACLEFNKQKRTVKTASREQVRQGIYTSSLRPWEGLEDELAPLLEAFPEAAKG